MIFPFGAHGQAVTSPCSNGIIAGFLDNPLAPVNTACVPTEAPRFVTDADLITLPVLREALNSGGLMSGSMFGFILRSVPGLLGALFLLSAVLVYPLVWLVGRLRGWQVGGATEGWTVGWTRAAPWLAFAAGLVLLAFLLGLGVASQRPARSLLTHLLDVATGQARLFMSNETKGARAVLVAGRRAHRI